MRKKVNCGFITGFLGMLISAFSADFFIKKIFKKFERKWKK